MNQVELKALLNEAAKPGCSVQRQNEIQCLLAHASPAMQSDGTYEPGGCGMGMLMVLEKLYVDTLQNRPELLPSLFPAFAVICGDRQDHLMYADVDWSLI